jgi:heat-inducible transcriptional repressor
MSTLTKRQEYLLGLIVREYVSSPTPVSSKLLVERYGLQFSTATVRNDMVALEE